MIIIPESYLTELNLINIKLAVPQVGFVEIQFNNLSDVENNTLFDFIITEKGELKIGKGHYKLNKKKDSLYFAGRLMITDGLISYLDNDSGHYVPSVNESNEITEVLLKTNLLTIDCKTNFN